MFMIRKLRNIAKGIRISLYTNLDYTAYLCYNLNNV